MRLAVTQLLCPALGTMTASHPGEGEKEGVDATWRGLTLAIVDLLFVPGLTLPVQFGQKSKIFYIIW